jgi:hypothetical protein
LLVEVSTTGEIIQERIKNVPGSLFLLETQRFDRIKQRGLSGRVKSEKDPYRTGKGKSQENRFYR